MANLTPSDGFKVTVCKHTNTFIRVLQSVVTCETTALFCADCGKQITEPNTEC